jgi:hypothetical protein
VMTGVALELFHVLPRQTYSLSQSHMRVLRAQKCRTRTHFASL